VLARLDEHCEHVLVHTGQNYDYELNQIFFDDLGVRKPDHFLNSAAGAPVPTPSARSSSAVDQVLAEVQPEAMLVLGDTNSCLAVVPAKRRKMPIFTWRPATAALISVCRKRSTGASSTTRPTST
jgi:UDP-N-acetylglucosamine 2-epimerase